MKPADVSDLSAVPSEADGVEVARFELLFTGNYDDLLSYCARRVGPDAAGDVVAEVFLVAWRRRHEYSQDGGRLWLFGVARKLVANEQRGQLRRTRLSERVQNHTEQSVPDGPLGDGLYLRQVLAALPPLEQEALRLTEWDQFEIGEAAAIAGCSRATFRVRLHRARRRLASRLTEQAQPLTGETS